MAQQVVIAGALFNDVPSISVPDSNSVYHPFTDVSDTTAAAADVASGKYFYTAAGVKTAGTASGGSPTLITKSITQNGTYNASSDNADGYSSVSVNVSGGGGGLVYETGTWNPSEDVNNATIIFSGTHSTAPFFYMVVDATNTYSNTSSTNHMIMFVNSSQSLNAQDYISSNSTRLGVATFGYRSTNATSLSNANTAFTSNEQMTAYATSTSIRAYGNSSSRYWRAGRTYKWIAVWAPTS